MLYSTLFRRGIDGVSVTRIERDPSNRENEKLKRNVLIEKQSNIDIYIYIYIEIEIILSKKIDLTSYIYYKRYSLEERILKIIFRYIFYTKNHNINENMRKHKTCIYIYIYV